MAETPKNPEIEETKVVNTAPVSEIPEEPVVPEPVAPEPVEEPVMETVEETIEEPITPEPVETEVAEPVVVEPTVETTVEPVIETPTPVVAEEPTKTTDTKVETVQDIKAKETSNEAQENELNETKKNQVVSEMQKMIQNGSTLEEIAAYGTKNIKFKDDINTVLRGSFKNLANAKYFGKYSTLNNEDMYAAYQSWLVVPWSEQYNLLPPEKKSSFDAYLKEQEASNLSSKTDFTASEKVTDLTYLESQISKMYSSTARENYNKTLNSEQFITLSNQITQKKIELEKMDIEMEDLQEDLEKELAGTGLAASVRAKSTQAYKTAVKDKRLALAEYNAYIWQYQTLKSNAETELEIAMYEDGIAREQYQTELSLYETRRKEALSRWEELEDREFALKTQQQAEARQQAFTIEMKELDQRLKAENKSWTYQTDREWNLLYVVNGIATQVKNTDWTVVWVTQKKWEYSESIQKNTDGTYSIFRTYEDGRKPEMFNYWIDWKSSYNTQMGVYDAIWWIDSKPWKYFNWEIGKLQCWEAVNRYLKTAGIVDMRVWNSYESKKAIINNNVPQVGWLAVWNPNSQWEFWEYGHIGIVTWYNPDKWEVEITDWNKEGNWEKNTYNIPVSQVLNSDGWFTHLEWQEEVTWDISTLDISTYNNSTFKPQDLETEEEKAKYQNYLDQKESVFSNKDAELSDILKYSRWAKPLTDTSVKSLEKFDSALTQIGSIQEQISKMETWPVLWRLKSINPYDTDAQTLKASLTSLIPNLARGVYGEVGVLTDNDVRLYSQTIPNLTSTNDTNDAVLAMTLKVVAGWYKRQLQSLAASWKDVSWFEGLYQNLTGQVEAIENRLWIKEWWVSTINSLSDEFNSYNNSAAWVANTQADYSSTLWF